MSVGSLWRRAQKGAHSKGERKDGKDREDIHSLSQRLAPPLSPLSPYPHHIGSGSLSERHRMALERTQALEKHWMSHATPVGVSQPGGADACRRRSGPGGHCPADPRDSCDDDGTREVDDHGDQARAHDRSRRHLKEMKTYPSPPPPNPPLPISIGLRHQNPNGSP